MSEKIEIITTDDFTVCAEVFGLKNDYVLLINPAIGVKRRMYHDFASFMSDHGVTTVLYNYRGMEDNNQYPIQTVDCDVEVWARLDQSAVIKWITSHLKPGKLLVLGHSLGGQIPGFANNFQDVDGLIHVAAQKGDKQLWSKVGYFKLLLLWHVLIPLMSRGQYFNAIKLGLGNYPWPAAAAKQWARWGQHQDYLFNPEFGFDLSPWHNFNKPILCFGFTDDHMAPEKAIDGLLEEYGKNHDQTHIEKRIINPKLVGVNSIGHFGFFKKKTSTLWHDTLIWIKKQ